MQAYNPLDAFLPRASLPPIDLARSVIFLFRRDGERILWASDAARRFLGVGLGDALEGKRLGPLLPSSQRLRALGEVLQAHSPPRLERIPFFVNLRFEPLTCVCRIVPLRAGGEALLLTTKEVRVAAPIAAEPDLSVSPPKLSLPNPSVDKDETAAPPPAWAAPDRASLRFTFDSDRNGVIEAVSSEFAKAVGPISADVSGRNWDRIAQLRADAGAAHLAALSRQPEPFRAVTITWPMDDGRLVPIDVSGAPRLIKGAVLGIRGFGLVRLADAVLPPIAEVPLPEKATPETVTQPITVSAAEQFADADLPPPDKAPVIGRIVEAVHDALGRTGNIAPINQNRNASLERLSQQERNAFRDIARALGARFEGDDPVEPILADLELPESVTLTEDIPASETVGPALSLEPHDQPIAGSEIQLPSDFDDAAIASEAIEAASLFPDMAAPVAEDEPEAYHDATEQADGEHENDRDDPRVDVLNHLPIGILVLRDGQPIYLNETLLTLLGQDSVEAVLAAGGAEALFAEDLPTTKAEPAIQPTLLRKVDGETLAVDAHLQIVPWTGGPATVFSFRRQRDEAQPAPIHEPNGPLPLALSGGNVALEAQLRARDAELAEFRGMLDIATDGVISLTNEGRMLAVNRPVEALFGYDAPELVGERLSKLFASESHAAVVDYLDGLNANGVQSILAEGRNVFGREKNGGRIPLFLTIGRVSASGKLCAVLRDLTNWKKAEADLTEARLAADRASNQKSQFLAKISHEIRTPMNSIIGFSEVMMDQRFGSIGNDRYVEYLRDIHRSGQHVVSLVNDLLDLSKIEAGKADLTFSSVNLNDIVKSCVSMMEPQALREKVFLRTQLDTALPQVVADERSIRQIVINLLSNSAKFNVPGGQILISTARTAEGEAVIRVKDTGIGMSEDELDLAMQPFKQLPTSNKGAGTGLGLPLTKALAEANRAALRINSAKGEGTLSELIFPPTRVLAE